MHSLYTFSRNIPFWCNFQIWWWNILQAVKPGNRGKLSFALPQTTFLWFTLLCCVIVKLFNNNEFICKIDSWWLINWVSAESAVEMYKACLNWITSNFPRINFVRLFLYDICLIRLSMISSYSPTAPLLQPATPDVVASEEGSAARRWKSSPIGTLSF